jgi:hypothetical protein
MRIGTAGALALLILTTVFADLARAEILLSVSPGPALPGGGRGPDDLLRRVNSANGSTLGSVTITLAGLTITGGSGLARHPQTDALYALLRIQGRTFPDLVTLDEATGVATSLGNTSDKFAGIAFADDGTLYGVSGDGGIIPESLYTLSTVDASATFIMLLEDGSDGETLAFNPDDGLLYHASGIGNQNQTQNGEIFETIDPGTLNVTSVNLSGFDYEELTGLVYSNGGIFFGADLGDSSVDMPGFLEITTGGVVTFVGDMDHVAKGLVRLPEPARVLQLLVGVGFLGVIGRRRMRA